MAKIEPHWLKADYNRKAEMRYQAALDSIPPPGSGCHPALLSVANLGVMAGMSADKITADIRAAIPEGRRRVPDREILDAVKKATDEKASLAERHLGGYALKPKPIVDPVRLRKNIMAKGSPDEADLWDMSPVALYDNPAKDASLLLQTLYQPSDVLFIGGIYDKAVRPVADWLHLIDIHGPRWPHIIPNPVDGQLHPTKSDSQSYRCDAAVCGFPFALAEFDDMPRSAQMQFWSGWIAADISPPVAALIDSGGKSIHAWLRVERADRESWATWVKDDLFAKWLMPLGVDRACRNESRLSRLPGHRREGGNVQRLLYLVPVV